jgi:hypothetical protein
MSTSEGVIVFELPCHVIIGSKNPKTIPLNMNWYRNAHYQITNKVKQAYQPIKGEWFEAKKIAVSYTLHLPNNRRTDLMNWLSIADKFFLDWLVTNGCLYDDGIKQYPKVSGSASVEKGIPETYITAEVQILERKSA